MNKCEVDIYVYPKDYEHYENIYGYCPATYCNIEKVTFYKMPDAIYTAYEYNDGGTNKFTKLYVNGTPFCSPVDIDTLKRRLEAAFDQTIITSN